MYKKVTLLLQNLPAEGAVAPCVFQVEDSKYISDLKILFIRREHRLLIRLAGKYANHFLIFQKTTNTEVNLQCDYYKLISIPWITA